MRFLLRTLFTLATLAVLAVAALFFLVPEEAVREQAVALVKQQTGRDLEIRGDTAFTFYPDIGVEMNEVALSNPPEMKDGPMLRMESLTLSLELMPLLSRSVQIERVVLVRPVLDLRIDGQGRRNWDFPDRQAAAPDADAGDGRRRAAAPSPGFVLAQAGGSGGGGLVRDLHLGAVRVEQGAVHYTDARGGVSQRIEALDLTLRQAAPSEPLDAEGDLVWRGEKISFEGEAGSPTSLLRGGASAVTVSARSARGEGRFEGRIAAGEAFSAEGEVAGETPSLRKLAAWAAGAPWPGKAPGKATLDSRLTYEDGVVSFSETRFSLDDMSGQGKGSLSLKGDKPYLRAAFAVDTLDLNAYAGAGEARAQRREGRPAPAPEQPETGGGPKEGQSLTDFIEQLNKEPKPEVRAWSRRALDFAALNALDADVNLNANTVRYGRIKIGESAVSASLKDGVLTANLSKLKLYDGAGTGRLTLNAARAKPALAATLDLKNVSALPLLSDAIQFDHISGKADIAVNLSGSGRTQKAIIATLQGDGRLEFRDGAIEGVNIPAMIRGLREGRLSGWKTDEREKTDFSRLSGSFTMREGVARNDDLHLVGPLIRMKGEGTVDLPRERLDYSLSPRLVATLEGQDAEDEGKGLMIPVRARGPWDDPRITPDMKRIMENPELTRDAVDKVGKAVEKLKNKDISGKDVERILQGVLGGGRRQRTGEDGQGAQERKVNPEDLLNRFLGSNKNKKKKE